MTLPPDIPKQQNTSVRIVVLISNFYPIVGGGEKHALLLCKELIQQGAQVTVITRRRHRHLPEREQVMGVPVVRVKPAGWPRLGKYLMLWAAWRELRRHRNEYDFVYVCGLRVLGILGVWAARQLKKSCILRAEALGEFSGDFIWRAHPGAPVRHGLKLLFTPLVKLRNRFLIHETDAFVSISAPVREEYLANGAPPEKIWEIANGIDCTEFRPATPEERHNLRLALGLPVSAQIGAYSGKLNRGKGLLFLLQLWTELVRKNRNLHLLLIGGGGGQAISCENELRGFIAQHNLQTQITITGYTTNVAAFLRAADFFVFPSESEAMALALLEALACGLPAVASRIAGVSTVINDGQNGLLAAAGDICEWEKAVNLILSDQALAQRLGNNGRQSVQKKFDIAEVARQHLYYFHRCGKNNIA